MNSKYLNSFKNIENSEAFTLKANYLLVEKLDLGEQKTAGGIILPGKANQFAGIAADKPNFCVVLMIGEGYVDDDGKFDQTEIDVKVGDVILLPSPSVRYFSLLPCVEGYDPDTIGITRDSEVQMVYRGQDAFNNFFNNAH